MVFGGLLVPAAPLVDVAGSTVKLGSRGSKFVCVLAEGLWGDSGRSGSDG